MKRVTALFLCAVLIAGCDSASRDQAEEENPNIRKGLERVQLKKWDEAIRHFQTALDNHPKTARPDLELALIYHQQKQEYVRAIYHYERYLEKRPDTEKEPLIADWIRQAKISLAAQVNPSGDNVNEQMIRLIKENELLRKQLYRFAPPAKQTRPEPKIEKTEPTPISAQPIARIQTPAPVPETYTVLPGDTLSKISRTVYGDSSKWKEIYGANLDKMKSENDLKAGQIITIPTLGN